MSLLSIPGELKIQKTEKRFETIIEDHAAFIDYLERGEDPIKMYLTHTEVAPELGGRGLAAKLVLQVLTWIKDQGYILYPYCPYIAKYIRRHPEWKAIVAKNFPLEKY
ncbi:MAG: GNAT family N-acetyltransferase [Bacteroidota bacterium]